MEPLEIQQLYGKEYAQSYDRKFLMPRHGAQFELEVLTQLLPNAGAWLDIACGTGYFLAQFPGFDRAGLDLSPAMLQMARKANPDARFLVQHDFRRPVSEWSGIWDLVTCMGYAYCYVDSVAEVEALVGNMALWTSDNGACFMPIGGFEDILGLPDLPYEHRKGSYANVRLTGFLWTWLDQEAGVQHENLLMPHHNHLISLFEQYFEVVQLVRYPLREVGWTPRKAILATRKHGGSPTPMEEIFRTIDASAHTGCKEAQPPISQSEELPAKAERVQLNGWLRRAWRKLPPEARRLVKAALGES